METAGMILQGSHEPSFVLLSIVIAIAAAYAALDLAGRATAARGRVRVAWIIGGAVAMGIGINAMHFVGMLGYHLPFAVLYDVPTVLASLLAAILASCVALFVVSRPEMRPGDALIGSLFMAAGIVAMHYTGMAAMRLAADAQYDPLLVALSVVVAISVSLVGLWLVFYLRDPSESMRWWWRIGGAVLMGLAIPSMHYVAMAAVQYTPVAELPDVSHAIQISWLGAALIGVATLGVLSLAVLTSVVDRRLEAQATALAESEERFRAVVETASDAIVSADKDGHIIYFNQGAERIFGYAACDIIGRPLTLLMPKRFHEAHRQGLARFLKTGEARVVGRTVELVGQRKEGTEFPLELSLASWKAGGDTFFTGILRDITDRKRAEEERDRFFTLSLDLMCIAGFDGYFKRLNPAWERTLGFMAEELLSEPYLNFVHPDDRETTIAEAKKIAAGAKVLRFENRYRCKDGSYRLLQWTAVPDMDQQLTYAAARDITDRRRAEEALQRAHDELERRVQERTAEIQFKNRDLETLLYVTSHDLREPLRSIENFSRMVHDRYAQHLDDKGRDFLQRVVRGAKRMDFLLADVLALSRAQRMESPNEEVESESIVHEALLRLDDLIKRSGADVRVAKNLPLLQVNRTWATQGVYNLVANALKFTRDGKPPEIEIAPYEPGKDDPSTVGLVVRDRGPGVAPEHAERIFQLFQRAVGREVEGTGAGLAIVRQVAERHGGRAWVQPREGGGSEFVLTFGTSAHQKGGKP